MSKVANRYLKKYKYNKVQAYANIALDACYEKIDYKELDDFEIMDIAFTLSPVFADFNNKLVKDAVTIGVAKLWDKFGRDKEV